MGVTWFCSVMKNLPLNVNKARSKKKKKKKRKKKKKIMMKIVGKFVVVAIINFNK